jgi:hypothetical protein
MFDIVLGNLVFEHGLAIEFDRYRPVLADNFLSVPDIVDDGRLLKDNDIFFVVGGRRFRAPCEIAYAIQAAGAPPIAVAVVHLAFDSKPGPTGLLKFRAEINPRIGAGVGHYVHAEIEVFELMPVHLSIIKQMGWIVICGGTLHHDHAVTRLEDVGIVADLPAVKALSVKKAHEAFFGRWRLGGERAGCQQQDQSAGEAQSEQAPGLIRQLARRNREVRGEAKGSSPVHDGRTLPDVEGTCQVRTGCRGPQLWVEQAIECLATVSATFCLCAVWQISCREFGNSP